MGGSRGYYSAWTTRVSRLVPFAAWLFLAGCSLAPVDPEPVPAETPQPEPTATPTEVLPPPPTATLTVRPLLPLGREVARGDPDDPRVALTFDCGNVSGPTAAILDVLKRHGLKVTFFISGAYADRYPELTRRIAADGHEVSNHTYTHGDLTKLSDAGIMEELQRAETALQRITGKSGKPWIRMPFGARNERVWNVVAGAGYTSIYWTLDSGDWQAGATAQSVRKRVLDNVDNGYIVVQHCNSLQTAESLPEVLQTLRSTGHPVVTVSALLGYGPRETDRLLEPVSKSHGLPADYTPPDLFALSGVPVTRPGLRLRQIAYEPLKRMLSDARAQGIAIVVASPYRSYEEQAAIFAAMVRTQGEAHASRYSARAGHSEHQLGTTIDFTSPAVGYALVEAFGATPEGRWLRENAHGYGFVMSYPEGKESITGYAYEPWHFRYVGDAVAADVRRRGLTLVEYLESR